MSVPDTLLAYGPAPGMEFIPYFLALLGWIGLALGSFILWPVTALIRRLRRGRSVPPGEPTCEARPVSEPAAPERSDGI